ncbi:MAG TPA: ATP-dependent 6-phosphofructokinase [Polyangiaceae bacterium]|nr:ATP-dependent 6-phosphofructokinase [Polyangiaceae bacterium]
MHLLINTGGGDAPGLNAVIRAVTLSALRRGFRVTGIRRGYSGLLDQYPSGLVPLTRDLVRGIGDRGGTILGTVNKGNPFQYPVPTAEDPQLVRDLSDRVVQHYREVGADALIAVGGDGSLRIAQRFMEKGMRVIAVPKTIDNDLGSTEQTFGFESAMAFATDALSRLQPSAEAHSRVMVVEVMGRYAGWIALYAGIAAEANGILLPEIDFDIDALCRSIRHRYETGRPFATVVVAEGAKPVGGEYIVRAREAGKEITLGGVGAFVAEEIARRTGFETRSLVLGHLQRGGGPTAGDRILALRYGAAAVRLAAEGRFGHMVSYQPPSMTSVPIEEAIRVTRSVPLDHDAIRTAEDLGISLGR